MLPGTLHESEFFGKETELADLRHRVLSAEHGLAESAVLSGPRGIGKTELLKQLFSSLFWQQDAVVPFYYTVNPALLSASSFSKSYLTQFLCQRLAFEKKEQALLHLDGISMDGLFVLMEEQEARWAREILETFTRSAGDPFDALRVAVTAPQHSAVATGMPVAVLIDEFHLLQDLRTGDMPDPRLASLFEAPLAFRRTPHVITGNTAEIGEMQVSSGLARIPVQPLGPDSAAAAAHFLLLACDAPGSTAVPQSLLDRLEGNPFYLRRLVAAAVARGNPVEADFRRAYVHEITEGSLARSLSAVLMRFFPDMEQRRLALATAHKIAFGSRPLSCGQIARVFTLTVGQAEAVAHALYRAGIVRGEFGVFRAPEDRVLRDVLDGLYRREILGKSVHDVEEGLLETLASGTDETVSFEIALPMVKEAELVAAHCLEQVGKNLGMHPDAIGQLQIAVIEACINAMEHGKGTGKKVRIGIIGAADRLEVSIESDGREFVPMETGEPVVDREQAKASGRGWGIKLMKRFADEVRFEKTARGTRTILIKKFNKTAEVLKEDTENRE
jgi:serine/threonine-protein kinase RsbW